MTMLSEKPSSVTPTEQGWECPECLAPTKDGDTPCEVCKGRQVENFVPCSKCLDANIRIPATRLNRVGPYSNFISDYCEDCWREAYPYGTPLGDRRACDHCSDERIRPATQFGLPNPHGFGLSDYCDECAEWAKAEQARRQQQAAIDARHARLHVEVALIGTGFRLGGNDWVLATDIRRPLLNKAGTQLTLFTASCGSILITSDNPYFLDLCDELQVGARRGEGEVCGG